MELNIMMNDLELWKASGRFANEPHVHDDWYQVTMPVSGICDFVQERHAYQLVAGKAIVAHPQTEHFFQMDSDTSVIVIKFRSLPATDGKDGEREHRQQEVKSLHVFDTREINTLFRSWSAILLEDTPEPLQMQELEYKVQRYLSGLLKGGEHSRWEEVLPSAQLARVDGLFPGTADTHLARVLEYIHDNYASGVMDIDSMAAVAHQSRYHFMRSFKALTGSTPHQYVLRLRVEQASMLLRRTQAKVTDICAQCGFSSIDQFYRAFLRLKGLTPTEYRHKT